MGQVHSPEFLVLEDLFQGRLLGEEVQDLWRIDAPSQEIELDGIFQGLGHRLRKGMELFLVFHEGGQDPRPPFGDAVKGDGKESVVGVGVGESFQDIPGIGFRLCLGQGEDRGDFLEEQLVDVLFVFWGVHHFIHCGESIHGGSQDACRMGAIEHSHLSEAVGSDVRGAHHVYPCLIRREGLFQPFRLMGFHRQEEERFAADQAFVPGLQQILEIFLLPLGESGDNAVYKSVAEEAILLDIMEGFPGCAIVLQVFQDIVLEQGA